MSAYTFGTLVPVLMLEAVRQVREPVSIMYEGKVVREVQMNDRGGVAIIFDETENASAKHFGPVQAQEVRVSADFVGYHAPSPVRLSRLLDLLRMIEEMAASGTYDVLLFDDGFFVVDNLIVIAAYSAVRNILAHRLGYRRLDVEQV